MNRINKKLRIRAAESLVMDYRAAVNIHHMRTSYGLPSSADRYEKNLQNLMYWEEVLERLQISE